MQTYIPGENAFRFPARLPPQTLAVLSRVLGCLTPWQEAKPSLISAGVQADMLRLVCLLLDVGPI